MNSTYKPHASRSIMHFHARSLLVAVSIACALLACTNSSNKPAPEPTPNPKPKVFSALRVQLKSGEIDDLHVNSVWSIRNFGCAPINQPAGNLNVGQPNTRENVTKKAQGEYDVAVEEDRYVDDACHWARDGTQFNFMHKGEVFAVYAMSVKDAAGDRRFDITCTSRDRWPGVCRLADKMPPSQLSRTDSFNGSIELLP